MGYKRNRRTGEVIFVPDGPEAIGPQRAPDPTIPYKAPQVQAQIANTQAGTQKTYADIQGQNLQNTNIGRTIRQNPISAADQAIIDRMRQNAEVATRASRELTGAADASDRFNPGPNRARTVERAITSPDDGWLEQQARNAYGWAAGVDDQDIRDFQNLDAYRQGRVATIQQEQKGAQTESDALRYMKSTFGPDKAPEVNARAIGEAVFAAEMDKRRPGMYSWWANKHGSLSALNERGESVDDWWGRGVSDGWKRYQKSQGGKSGGKPAKGGAEFLGWED